MTLPASGAISFGSIATELSGTGGPYNIQSFGFRRLSNKYSGALSISNFYSTSSIVLQDTPWYSTGSCGRCGALRVLNTYSGLIIRDVAFYPNCSGYPGPDAAAWTSVYYATIPLTKGTSIGTTGIISVYNSDGYDVQVSGWCSYSYDGDRSLTITKTNYNNSFQYWVYVMDLYDKSYTKTFYDNTPSVSVGD